jgi:DNA-binding beta-propeller fold protein YncE
MTSIITTLSVQGFVYNMAADSVTGRLYVMHAVTNDDNVRFVTVFDRAGAKLTAQPVDIGVNTIDGGELGAVASTGHVYAAGTECMTVADAPCAGYSADGRVQALSKLPPQLSVSLGQDITPAGPSGMAVDDSRSRVYVTSKGANGLLSAISDAALGGP